MDYFDGSKCKTSTPRRGSCKRLNGSVESSPIFSNTFIRTNLMDDADDDIFNSNLDENDCKELENGKKLKIDDNTLIKIEGVSNCVPKSSSVDIFSGSSGQSLLSVDNSFLKILDLNTLPNSSDKTICCKSSHTDLEKHFNSSLVTEDIGDDHAWDMSISAEIKHEHCQKILCTFSQEVNNIFCDSVKWEDDTIINKIDIPDKNNDSSSEKHNVSFGSRIKTILLNNAQKPISKLSEKDKIGIVSQETANSSGSTFYGLPILVKSLIKKYKGINQLYDWQEECLKLEAVRNRKNLVYALPTSGGKTLVAEILILNEILCKDKNAIFVMPYVSIVQEKVRSLSPFAVELGFLIEEYAGAKGQYPPQKRRRKRTVFIATIEKALGLIHSYLENNRMSELGLVVVDELHLIGEPRRGATLESMLVKLMYAPSAQHVHIIGMSATIGNVNEIAQFLKADVYTHDFRPVELKEYIKVENEVFYVNSKEDPPLTFHSTTSFPYSDELKKLDPDEIGGLVREVAPHESCLVFCPSKKNCENVALLICQTLDRNFLNYMTEEKHALYKALASEGNGTVCRILGKTLPYGVAYHNSGLTTAERKLLEEAFCAKTIFCICCTSTLAAGVNLPAKRVILRSPYVGREFINLTRYKQMVGRAGRAGLSGGAGESFLICKPSETQKVGELIHAPMDYCKSHIFVKESLTSFLISAIGLSIATTVKSLTDLLKGTLLHLQNSKDTELDILVSKSISQLISSKALKLVKSELQEESLILTSIGKAAMKGGFDMDIANAFYSDLETAKKSLVLLNHMHLLYLVTPYSMLEQIKLEQQIFIKKFMKLEESQLQVASILGIDERCVSCMMSGRKLKNNVQEKVHRFYLSCILHDLWNEESVWEVSEFYQVTRGLVHTLLNSAVSFAASATRFCEELEDMWCFRRLLVEITSRLSHCCKPELIPLMELPAVKLGRARQLYEAGFKTVNIIANAEPQALVKAIAHLPRRVAHQIVAAAKLTLMTTAETLQEEAEEVLSVLKNKMATV